MVAASPTAGLVKQFGLGILSTVGDEEDVGQRVIRRAAVADALDVDGVQRVQCSVNMRAAGAEVCIRVGVKLRGEVGGGVVDGPGGGWRSVDDVGQLKIFIKVLNERIEPDPELFGNYRLLLGDGEHSVVRVVHGVADRVGAQLNASVGALGR